MKLILNLSILLFVVLLAQQVFGACDQNMYPIEDTSYAEWDLFPVMDYHYQAVDEYLPNTNDRVSAYTTGYKEIYDLSDTGCFFPNVTANISNFLMKYYAKGSGGLKPVIDINGTLYYGDTITLSLSYAWYYYEWTVNPATGNKWQESEIKALKGGMEKTGGGFSTTYVATARGYING